MPDSLSGRVLARVADFVAARGHDPEPLFRTAGVALASLRDPSTRVPYALTARVAALALELTRDENFGLHLAQDVRDATQLDAGLLMMMSSPTLGTAIERMVNAQRYWGDGDRTTLHPTRDGAIVRYTLVLSDGAFQRHTDECALAEMVLGARVLSGHDVIPRAVRFRHAQPADRTEHDALFRCPIAFASQHTELELGRESLDLSMRFANDAYCAIFQQQVDRALARLPRNSGTTDAVRSAARAALAGGSCSLEGTARVLGMSARTLQRRLHADGTSFGALLDALRRELADEYLARQLSIPEIAWLLGYAEPSAFHHAFKRWTGTSPEQARARSANHRD